MRRNAMFTGSLIFAILGGCATGPAPVDRPPAPSRSAPAEPASEVAFMALALIGTPYALGGTSPEAGFDCSGLVAYVYNRALRIDLPRDTLSLARTGQPVADPQPGDLLFYNTQGRAFSHVGIYLGEWRFVHAPATGGAVRVEDMRRDYWTKRYDGARRVAF